MKSTQRSAKRIASDSQADEEWTADERAAVQERVKEMKAARKRSARGEEPGAESEVLAKIAEMTEPDKALAERLHALVKEVAPELSPKTWYGMPAYVKDGQVVCFFQPAHKFKSRYATLGFSDKAALDDGAMWPTSYALMELTPVEEARIAALLKEAVGRPS
jgi:uncharacterized protein YdhG (YjbR/CyaY superfamily)